MLTPVTTAVLYTKPVAEGQTDAGPVMEAGVAGMPLSASVLARLLPQALLATTESVPLTNPDGTVMVMEVPVLAVMVHPEGGVQV